MIHRSPSSALNSRTALLGASLLLLLIALTPTRFSGWTSWLGNLAEILVAPVQQPLTGLVGWLRGPGPSARPNDPELARLVDENNIYRVLYYRTLDEKNRLEQQIVQLQRGLALNPDLPVRQFTAPVIGRYSDLSTELLKVRGGAANGITLNSVGVYDGVYLVGRVVGVTDRITSVLPITDRSAGEIRIHVFPTELAGSAAPDPGMTSIECKLVPTGGGRLRGPAESRASRPGEQPPRLAPGMVARLRDASWPRSAQMLVVGVIERIDTAANGREVVTVKPMFDLQRLPELAIRISGEPDAPDDGTDALRARPRTRPEGTP